MLTFFKKEKVANSADLEAMSIVLPKSKIEKTVGQVINEMDEHYEKEKKHDPEAPQMANGEHHVMVGEEKMKVNDLVKKHMDMCNEMKALKEKHEPEADHGADEMHNDEDEVAKKKALELAEHEEKEIKEKKANEEKEHEKEEKEKKHNAFLALKNAQANAPKMEKVIDLGQDQVARGKSRYGSSN